MKFADLRAEYARLWAEARITTRFETASLTTARKVLAGKERYQKIESDTGVPWYVVGTIHALESGCRWSTHLHNGDPLTAKTKRIPKNRPAKGSAPFTWEESACDALMLKDLHQITDWSPERICYELERYNGFGYRMYHPSVLSPYLWSGTQHYTKGKYVADGKWDSNAVSAQTGAIPLLIRLAELDATVTFGEPVPDPELQPEPESAPGSFPKAEPTPVKDAAKESWTIWGALVTFVGMLLQWLENAVAVLLDAAQQVVAWSPIQGLFATAGANVKPIGISLAVAGVVIVIARRLDAAAKGKTG